MRDRIRGVDCPSDVIDDYFLVSKHHQTSTIIVHFNRFVIE